MDRRIVQHLIEKRLTKLHIAIVGDLLEDVYQYGKVHRVSPEFPVPILRSPGPKTITVPGGSGNVGLQLAHLNCDVTLFGFADKSMNKILIDHGFSDYGLVPINSGHNPRKVRFYDDDFPLLRWDIEEDFYGCKDELHKARIELVDRFINMIRNNPPDVVVLSNYGKGVFNQESATRIISECNLMKITTVVDPKSNPSWWVGCDVFKPNMAEARALCSGLNGPSDQAVHLKNVIGCKSVVITMAGSGIAGWSDAPFSYAPKSPIRDVASVIGAGDCFAAILAFGIGHGLKIDDACELAFEAGSQYVTARHNRPLTWYEIHRKIDPTGAKIVNINDFNYIRKHVLENQKLVFSNGCFDFGLTRGHIDCLNFAKNNGEKLIVGINDDDSVRRLKGESRPIMNIEDRMYVVAGLESVDFVVKFSEDTPEKLIENIKPDLIVKGGDYKPHEVVGHKVCKVLICPMTESVSTTDKIKLISKEM